MPAPDPWNILVTAPRAVEVMNRYRTALEGANCRVTFRLPLERFEEEDMLEFVAETHGIICGDDRISARVLEAAPRLRVISKWGTGIDSIDLDHARRLGIIVRNTPGAFSEPVADTVFGYILAFARQPCRMTRDMRAGAWQRIPLRALNECTLGVVGLGACGRAVARRALAFGMRVISSTLSTESNFLEPDHVRMVSLDSLLVQSDFVTLHADLRPDNRHLIDDEKLALMKPTAVLVNTARGGLVDEQALVAALQEGRIAGAALDVFEQEPLPLDSPLRRLENVELAPHNANSSQRAAEHVHENSIRNLLETLKASTDR